MKLREKLEKYQKVIDFLAFYLMFFSGVLISIAIKANFIVFSIFSLLPSVVYLLFKIHKSRKKILIMGTIISIFGTLVVDSIAQFSKAWYGPTIFPIRLLGAPIEDLIWCFLYMFLMLIYYEYFFDTRSMPKLPKSSKYLFAFMAFVSIEFSLMYFFNPFLLNIHYFYIIFICTLIVGDILALAKYKKLKRSLLVASFLLFPFSVVHELTSLVLNHWSFPIGQHIGYIYALNFAIPIEEVLWFVVIPLTMFSIYEIFIDNQKS